MATQELSTPATELNASPLSAAATVLISVPSLAHDALGELVARVTQAFSGRSVVIASPDAAEDNSQGDTSGVRVAGYTPSVPPGWGWTLSAADFVNARELHARFGGDVVIILGAEAQTFDGAAIAGLADAVLTGEADLATARYDLLPRAGLVNSAILYPVSRGLFAARPRYPLSLDMAMSPRTLDRVATAAQKLTALNQPGGLVWPVAEAAVAGFTITEVACGTRTLPQPDASDLNSLLAHVTGSLFVDVESKAAWWQRARPVQPARIGLGTFDSSLADRNAMEQVQPMLDTFRLAYGNLHEIWSLVLPPQTLLGLKRLSVAPPSAFQMADSLWARIVYDFLLAYRLRTLNRGHLLGALTPLYLAWVASHILLTASGGDPERHIEAVALAFETDKPYLVSRWRWPDRFNP